MSSFSIRTFAIATVALIATSSDANAQVWTGTADNLWTNSANWDTVTVPVSGNTATFNGTGNGNTNISLSGASQPIGSILFDTASAAAYNLGVLASGDAFNFDSSGSITVNSTVPSLETINANIATNGPLTVMVTSLPAAPGLSLAGVISGPGPVTINNVGNVAVSGQNTYTG